MTAPRADFPICLYSTGVVSAGGIYTPDADDLQNHFDTPIQIEEIRFMFYLSTATGILGTLAGLIRVRLRMGRIELTNEFIPTWLLGSRMQTFTEFMSGGGTGIWDYQRWKLPCPVIVPPGATLLPNFIYQLPDGTTALTNANNSPITVYVTMIGRSLSKMPTGKIRVPYATAYLADGIGGGQQSQDDQLVNKFDVPLHVQRFVGRLASKFSGGVLESWRSDEGFFTTGNTLRNITIRDHAGYAIVDTPTPFIEVFSKSRKILPANRILEPRGWYTVFLQDKPSNVLPQISMIGWREVELVP